MKPTRKRIKAWLYEDAITSEIGGHKILHYTSTLKPNGFVFRVIIGERLPGFDHKEDYKYMVYTHHTDKGSYGALTKYRRLNSLKRAVKTANKLILSNNGGDDN